MVEERCVHPELLAVPNRASHDASEDVAASFVGGHHAIRNEERGCARMVGNHTEGERRLIAAGVRLATELGDGRDDALEGVDVVIRVDVLKDRRDTLEPGARID